jgi:hypothetical protein
MQTDIPEKLLSIVDEIEDNGSANLTRLTVLKKWFQQPGRLPSFGLWVARRAAGRKGKTKGEAGRLLNVARDLLGKTSTREDFFRQIDATAARLLYEQARDVQSEFKKIPFGAVRSIACKPLLLVEKGLALYLSLAKTPEEGYQLAANYCEHYDSRVSAGLNGPSSTKIQEIVRFMFIVEAMEVESQCRRWPMYGSQKLPQGDAKVVVDVKSQVTK